MNDINFDNAYDAGFAAGRYGANNFNSHYKWFKTKESLKEWQRGNTDGSNKREAEREKPKSKKLK